ncbi:hypothetical protein Tco_0135635, partial [Tanacetum coccineum]
DSIPMSTLIQLLQRIFKHSLIQVFHSSMLVDEDCNVCEDASACLSKDNAVNQKSVRNNDQVLLEDRYGLFDSEVVCRDSKEDNENQSANVSICDHYAMIKVHEET